jgi:hypothetical protein
MDKNTERYRMLSDEIHTKIKQEVSRIGKKKISLISEEDKQTHVTFHIPFKLFQLKETSSVEIIKIFIQKSRTL